MLSPKKIILLMCCLSIFDVYSSQSPIKGSTNLDQSISLQQLDNHFQAKTADTTPRIPNQIKIVDKTQNDPENESPTVSEFNVGRKEARELGLNRANDEMFQIPQRGLILGIRETQQLGFINSICEGIFKKYGGHPFISTILSPSQTFNGHHGVGEKLIYRLPNEVVLRYDITVPTVEVAMLMWHIASQKTLNPIQRAPLYQIGKVFRNDVINLGHFSEFHQANFEIIGSDSIADDATFVTIPCQICEQLNIDDFILRLNHRKILAGMAELIGEGDQNGVLKLQRILDANDKSQKGKFWTLDTCTKLSQTYTKEQVSILQPIFVNLDYNKTLTETAKLLGFQEQGGASKLQGILEKQIELTDEQIFTYLLTNEGVNQEQVEAASSIITLLRDKKSQQLFRPIRKAFAGIKNTAEEDLKELFNIFSSGEQYNTKALDGINELLQIIKLLPQKTLSKIDIDLTLARGADYYTGMILEGVIPGVDVGAICGGGRYDNLVKACNGPNVGSVGFAVGVERIFLALKKLNKMTEIESDGMVIVSDKEDDGVINGVQLAETLRNQGIPTDFLQTKSIEDATEYARAHNYCGVWSMKKQVYTHISGDYENLYQKLLTIVENTRIYKKLSVL